MVAGGGKARLIILGVFSGGWQFVLAVVFSLHLSEEEAQP